MDPTALALGALAAIAAVVTASGGSHDGGDTSNAIANSIARSHGAANACSATASAETPNRRAATSPNTVLCPCPLAAAPILT